MTHFNHEWDGSPAIPEAVGDRYYAQDLSDDFNYLKHLPYEVFLQGRSCGVMVVPTDTWDNDTNSLTLSGGFGVVLQDNLCVDPDENFVVPPITKSSPRYERIPFVDATLTLPNDNSIHYIVATPTRRSLLQRIKTVLSESYASRIRYDGVITIQDTVPTAGQILVGLCHNKEYLLLADNNPNQGKECIIFEKWYGENCIRKDLITSLQTYYGATLPITTNITINSIITQSTLQGVTLENCNFTINGTIGATASSLISNGTMNNCNISVVANFNSSTTKILLSNMKLNNCTITVPNNYMYIISGGSKLNNCTINADKNHRTIIDNATLYSCVINADTNYDTIIYAGKLYNCYINDSTASSVFAGTSYYIVGSDSAILHGCTIDANGELDGTFENCFINISKITSGSTLCSGMSTFNNCKIKVGGNYGYGIYSGKFVNCEIEITSTSSGTDIGFDNGKPYFFNCRIREVFNNGTANHGIISGGFYNCYIGSSRGLGQSTPAVSNTSEITLNHTYVSDTATSLSSTQGKLNVFNGAVLHTS